MIRPRIRSAVLATVLVISASLCVAEGQTAPEASSAKATQVAQAWFDALMRGDAAHTTSLSAVPFAFDGKRTIHSIVELRSTFDSIVAKNGKRDLKPTAIDIVEDADAPPNTIVVRLMIDDEGIAIFVRPGDTYKVIGFRD